MVEFLIEHETDIGIEYLKSFEYIQSSIFHFIILYYLLLSIMIHIIYYKKKVFF